MSSFVLTDEQLGQVFDQIPVLSGQPRLVEDLPGGLTNRNVKVITPDADTLCTARLRWRISPTSVCASTRA